MLQVSLNFSFSHFLRLSSGFFFFFVLFASFFLQIQAGVVFTPQRLYFPGSMWEVSFTNSSFCFRCLLGLTFGSAMLVLCLMECIGGISRRNKVLQLEDMSFSLLSITKKLCFLIFVY